MTRAKHKRDEKIKSYFVLSPAKLRVGSDSIADVSQNFTKKKNLKYTTGSRRRADVG